MPRYTPKGVCSKGIDFEIEDGVVRNVRFTKGCPGNTIGLSKLAEGRPVEEIIELLKGVRCGIKSTSCPDQLAIALKAELEA